LAHRLLQRISWRMQFCDTERSSRQDPGTPQASLAGLLFGNFGSMFEKQNQSSQNAGIRSAPVVPLLNQPACYFLSIEKTNDPSSNCCSLHRKLASACSCHPVERDRDRSRSAPHQQIPWRCSSRIMRVSVHVCLRLGFAMPCLLRPASWSPAALAVRRRQWTQGSSRTTGRHRRPWRSGVPVVEVGSGLPVSRQLPDDACASPSGEHGSSGDRSG
jgi:hypothetical protein